MKHKFWKALLSLVLAAVIGGSFLFVNPALPAASAEEAEEPLMRIALFSDLHVEYDLQNKEKPSRFSTTKAVRYARTLTGDLGVDVVLVGGDMTGPRGSWTEAEITKTKASIYESMSYPTKDGKVLFVTGNHDPQPSIATGKVTSDYSGDYENFMTGACGKFVSALYMKEVNPSLSPYNELLCYRYTINNIEFIGLNTPYLQEQAEVCGLYEEQGTWLEAQMEQIGREKTVFIMCHYPSGSVRTIVSPSEAARNNNMQRSLNTVLNQYPNVIYCYGHVHSGENWWAKTKTSDVIKPQGGVSIAGQNAYKSSGYISAHMGSMGFYDNVYQPGGLSAKDPIVVQFVMVEIYANRIVFQTHNTGNKAHPDGTREIAPLTIVRDMTAQFGLDPALGVYDPKKYESSVSTGSDASSDKTSDKTTDKPTSETASSDLSSDAAQSEGSSNLIPILILVGLIVILGGCAVVLVLVLKKKPNPTKEVSETEEKPEE